MKIVAVIPCRYGSTRFEGKPLSLISGKPMIQRVYEAVASAEHISRAIVATDDPRILKTVQGFKGEGMMTDPGNRSGTDRAGDAAAQLGLLPEDIVVNVQGDQPLLDSRCLDDVTAPFFSGSDIHMSTLAFKIINPDEITSPKDVKVVFDADGFALYFSRSPIPFGRDSSCRFDTYKHLGVYAYTRGFLDTFRFLPQGRLEDIEKLEQLRALEHGYRIKVVVTPYDSPEVDIPEDIARIEGILRETNKE
jgi:3-deoxy-manno-octulosonate cytidylyltransferase (CMP-KDO synthetase)